MPSIKRCTAIAGSVVTFTDVTIGGATGAGVPTGGTAGQALTKIDSTNYNTQWTTLPSIRQTVQVQTSGVTAWTIALADENKLTVFTAASAITVTVPLNATLAVPVGYRTDFAQTGSGKTTVSGATGAVTITATPSAILRAAGSIASLINIGTDSWILTGDLT